MSIVILDPISSGTTYLNAAKKLGLNFYVLSNDLCEIEFNIDESYIKINTNNFNDLVLEINKLKNVDAVLPGAEYAVPMAARLGKILKKNCLNSQAVEFVRNKFNFRNQLTKLNLSNINFFKVTENEPVQIPKNFSFPAVVKPIDMAGSINVSKVYNESELLHTINNFYKDKPSDIGFTTCGDLIVEEYIPGKEYSIEGMVQKDGAVKVLSITEKMLGEEPYFVEIGHVVGKSYESEFRTKMEQYALAVQQAIQLNLGPFHLEVRVTPSGIPVAIELAARLPGDNIVSLIESSYEVNLAEYTLCEYLNLSSPIPKRNSLVSAVIFFTCEDKDYFNKINGLSEFINHPAYLKHHIYYESGSKISVNKDWSSRIGYIMFASKNEDEIKNLIAQVQKKVEIL